MKLRLVKQGGFLGTNCDFYCSEDGRIFMSRTQLGYALQYKQPQNAITIIHKRYPSLLDPESVEVAACQFDTPPKYQGKATMIYMYNEMGIYTIVRKSSQPIADKYFNWVFGVIQEIKHNSYYIATEKDNKWLGIRQETKEVRKDETDHIKAFIAYAKEQGSSNADRYYVILTKLINNRLGIDTGGRDKADQRTLMKLKGLETVVGMHLDTLMRGQMPYKQIYQDVKRMIEAL